MRGKARSVLILIILFSIILMGCGSVNDSLTSGEQGEATINLAHTSEPILTPTPDNPTPTPEPTPTPDPTPTPIPEPLYYQYKGTNTFPEKDVYGEYYEYFSSYEKWLLTDAGIESRIDNCMEYYNISEEDATLLLVSYYGILSGIFDPVNFDTSNETCWIDDYISYEKEYGEFPHDVDDIQFMINSYIGHEDEYGFRDWDPVDSMISTYQSNLENSGDIHTYIYDEEWDWSDYAVYDSEEEYYYDYSDLTPISSNGHELKFGDKVEKKSGFHYYGGTVYEVNGEKVKARWEAKRDSFGFYSWSYISHSEKSNPLSGPFGMPYDDEYYNASELKRIDFLSW